LQIGIYCFEIDLVPRNESSEGIDPQGEEKLNVAVEPKTMVDDAGCVLSDAFAGDRGSGGTGGGLRWRSPPTTIAVHSTIATESDGADATAIPTAVDAVPNANGTAALLC